MLGPLSDRVGRRPVLIGGLLVFILASALCTLAPSIGVLIAARTFQGMGGCAGIVIGRAIIRDRFERRQAASMLGYVTMGFAIAPMLGPTIGGILNDLFGWRAIFGLQTGLGLLITAVAFFALPETRAARDPLNAGPSFFRSLLALIRVPAFWAYALTVAFGTSVFFSFLGGTPFVAAEILGMTGTEFGLYFVLVPGGFIIGNFLTARYAERIGLYRMIVTGSVIALFAVSCMTIAFLLGWYHPLSLFVPMYGIGFANGLTFANAIAGAVSVRPDLAGTASGLTGSLQVGFGAIATVVVGALLGAVHSVFPLMICMLILASAAVAAALSTKRVAV